MELSVLETASVCDLTTTGRRTGRPHTIEIWFAHHRTTLYLLAGGGERSDWVRNLMHTPRVTIQLGATTLAGHGRLIRDPDEARQARDLVFARYQPGQSGDLSAWREEALPVAIDLVVTPADGDRPRP